MSPLNKENQPVHVDDNLVLLEDQVCTSPTLCVQCNRSSANYGSYGRHSSAHVQFHKQFVQNKFGYTCKICDTLWFEGNLKNLIHDSVRVSTNISSKCFHFCRVVKHTPFFIILPFQVFLLY